LNFGTHSDEKKSSYILKKNKKTFGPVTLHLAGLNPEYKFVF